MQNKEEVQQHMFAHIAQWQQSGKSRKAFCQQVNLSYHIFHYWYKRYRTTDSKPVSSFIKLGVSSPFSAGTAHTELVLPDGKRLLFHQAVSSDYLKALIS